MRRKLLVILITGILILLASGYAPAKEPVDAKSTALKYISEFEGGKIFKAGGVTVLALTASCRGMGRQLKPLFGK